MMSTMKQTNSKQDLSHK